MERPRLTSRHDSAPIRTRPSARGAVIMAAATATLACGGLRARVAPQAQPAASRRNGPPQRLPQPPSSHPWGPDATANRHADHDHRSHPGLHGDTQRQPGRPGLQGDAPHHPAVGSATRASGTSPSSTPPLAETGPFYTDVQPGDLVYYNPLDSITIIYARTSSVPTLTKMGAITSNLDAFESLPDNVNMRIEARWQRRI